MATPVPAHVTVRATRASCLMSCPDSEHSGQTSWTPCFVIFFLHFPHCHGLGFHFLVSWALKTKHAWSHSAHFLSSARRNILVTEHMLRNVERLLLWDILSRIFYIIDTCSWNLITFLFSIQLLFVFRSFFYVLCAMGYWGLCASSKEASF